MAFEAASIWDWIVSSTPVDLGGDYDTELKMFENIILNYCCVYYSEPSAVSLECEELLYLYHYGESYNFSADELLALKNCLAVYGPYENISAALFVFAVSAMYVNNGGNSMSDMNVRSFLEDFSLEQQAKFCKEFLQNQILTKISNRDVFHILENHVPVFEKVRKQICDFAKIPFEGVETQEAFDDSGQAVFYFLKGQIFTLINHLYGKPYNAFWCYKQCINFEPNCFYWWYVSYLELKNNPEQSLEYACECLVFLEEAIKLAPMHLQLRTSMFILNVLVMVHGPNFRIPENWKLILAIFNDVSCQPAKEYSELHLKWICLRSTELFIRYSSNAEERKKGVLVLEDCLLHWPTCGLCLQALSLSYNQNSHGATFSDHVKAKQLLKKINLLYKRSLSNKLFGFCLVTCNSKVYSNDRIMACKISIIRKYRQPSKNSLKPDPTTSDKTLSDVRTSDMTKKSSVPTTLPPDNTQHVSVSNETIIQKAVASKEPPTSTNIGLPVAPINRPPVAFLKISSVSTEQIPRNDWEELISSVLVECPLNWISAYIDRIPDYILKFAKTKQSYLNACLKKKEFAIPDLNTAIEDNIAEVGSDELLCANLCVAALNLYLQNFRTFYKIYSKYLTVLGNESFCLNNNRNAYKILWNATNACYGYLVYKLEPKPNTAKALKKYQLQEKRAQEELEKAKLEVHNIENSPVVQYVKGKLSKLVGLVHDISLGHYRKAVELEPNKPLWYQVIYEELKQMRKSGCNQLHPNDEEIRACEKAHKLCPENIKYMIDLATVKMQDLHVRLDDERNKSSADNCKNASEIRTLLRKATESAPEGSRSEMLAKLKTAEMYIARGFPQRTSEAKKMFLECHRKWPKSSMVLHKMAKFYHYTCNVYPKARQFYEEAMLVAPRNFACLMDYLSLHGRLLQKYPEMIVLIDRCISSINETDHIVTLLIIKGQAYWLHKEDVQNNRINACNAWLDVFQDFSWLSFKVLDALTTKTSRTFGWLVIPFAVMRPVFMEQLEKRKMSKHKNLSNFIEKLRGCRETTGTIQRSNPMKYKPRTSSKSQTVANHIKRELDSWRN